MTNIEMDPFALDEKQSGDPLEVEVMDDRPPEDQRQAVPDEDGEADDDEIKGYGKRVQNRISKLRWEYHEERRAKEAAERMAEEAARLAEQMYRENQRIGKLVQTSHGALTQQSLERAKAELTLAQDSWKRAYETGDPDQIAQAQQRLMAAQMAQAQAPAVSQQIIRAWQAEAAQQPQQPQTMPPQVPKPDTRAVEWHQKNSWFGHDKEMTSFAYGVHERLVRDEGIDPNSQEYYDRIDERMREIFPHQFGGQAAHPTAPAQPAPAQRRAAPSVVAPVQRNNGATPRRVQLTATQVRLAKRLGLTPEQYAEQLLKEGQNG